MGIMEKSSGLANLRAIICIVVTATLIGCCDCSYNTSFHWLAGDWSRCLYKEPGSCCDCHHIRDISCVYLVTEETVPPFYCHKTGRPAPTDREPCSPCQQDCVLSTWSVWSRCSDACTPGTRHRTRDVILPPHDGGATCPSLVEVEECHDPDLPLCILADLNPRYSWTSGPWSSCIKLTNDSMCGEGVRDRHVTCIDDDKEIVADDYCLYYLHGSEPISEELCTIPCDCDITSWAAWGPCSRTCHKGATEPGIHGYQVRTRSIRNEAEEGGATCPSLKDTKLCDINLLPRCPRYIWFSSDWGECTMPDPTDRQTICGPGLQMRDVYCILQGGEEYMPLADVLCIQDSMSWPGDSSAQKPPERRACQVSCPVDCVLGEWENWSTCTQTCGDGGIRIRTRPIVQEITPGGENCVTKGRYEDIPCDPTPCSWWHTGQWSACFADSGRPDDCGAGNQVRSVYCLSSLDEMIDDMNCTKAEDKPMMRQACRIPCPHECVVGEWQDWSECSMSCGLQGGVQTRHRQITDGVSDPGAPCLPSSELQESRLCNQIPCKIHLWQFGPWLECVHNDNVTIPCGEGTGLQTREITCQMDPGYPVLDKYCDPVDRPISTEVCAAPCGQDCKLSGWSDWSVCSQTCGPGSYKVKFRTVLRWPLYGGRECPGDPDENGLILKKKTCSKRSMGCSAAQWNTTEWGECHVKGHTKGHECGKGVQQRNVTCVKENGQEINEGICYEEGLGAAPDHERSCHVTCPGDCRLSPWSQYTPCSQTCGATSGIQSRSRYTINPDPSRSLSVQCRDVKDSDLTETVSCDPGPCPSYTWITGDWGSCIPHNTQDTREVTCGEGVETRHVFCHHDDGIYVPDHMCDVVAAMPRRQQRCHVPCPVDCQLSHWSVWSNCSQICGDGLRHRERKVIVASAHGGRRCPPLQAITTCYTRDCHDFDWSMTDWGPCEPHWDLHCGLGYQYREVRCPAGDQYDKECMDRRPRLPVRTECVKPCVGDCVMSEWSDFTHCDCRVTNATRSRFRQIIQEPVPSARQCGPITDTEQCDCPVHHLIIGGWTNCQVLKPANKHEACGKGIEKRPVNCVRSDGVIVHLSNCRLGNLTLSQSCEVICVKDCRVSDYTDWSECTDSCGVAAMMTRQLDIDAGNQLGRVCPVPDQLVQMTVCNDEPCYNYTWYRGPWNGCHGNRPGTCGVTMETRIVECRRSDHATVDDVFCLQNDLYAVNLRDDFTQREKVELDLDMERSCGEPCPGDCVVTEWSEFGPCLQNCSHPMTPGVQSRSRAVVHPALGGAQCPWDTIQTRPCPSSDSLCPLFMWEVGKWNSRNRRKVHCVLQGGLTVNGGCTENDQPSRHRDCTESCPHYADCAHGKCLCQPGFTEGGAGCLPEFGCAGDEHCFLNNTYCDLMNKECLCHDDTLPGPDLTCLSVGAASSTSKDPLEELNQLFIYILIGCLIALLVLGIITVVCMIRSSGRKKRRHGNRDMTTASNKLTKIDNLDTMPRNNDIDTKPDPDKLDKNIARSWENVPPYSMAYHPNLTQRSHSDNETPVDETTSSANTSSPSFSSRTERKLENVEQEEDVFSDSTEDDMSMKPFLSDRDHRSSSRGASYSPEMRVPPRPKPRRSVPPQLGGSSYRPVPPPRPDNMPCRATSPNDSHHSDDQPDSGSLGSFRPESTNQSTPSNDSDLTTIWIPQNDLNQPEIRDNRFPVNPQTVQKDPLAARNVTSTPPHMYENLSSADDSPEVNNTPPVPPHSHTPEPPVPPRIYTPDSPHPLVTDRGRNPVGRPISRRNHTEPVPVQFRNGALRPGNVVAPSPSRLVPQHDLTESNSAKDFNDLQGFTGANNASPQTQDLMSYCDELLADLQRVANS